MPPFPLLTPVLTKERQRPSLSKTPGHGPTSAHRTLTAFLLPRFPSDGCIYQKLKPIPAAEMLSRKPKRPQSYSALPETIPTTKRLSQKHAEQHPTISDAIAPVSTRHLSVIYRHRPLRMPSSHSRHTNVFVVLSIKWNY